jgi:hypothetical protein
VNTMVFTHLTSNILLLLLPLMPNLPLASGVFLLPFSISQMDLRNKALSPTSLSTTTRTRKWTPSSLRPWWTEWRRSAEAASVALQETL